MVLLSIGRTALMMVVAMSHGELSRYDTLLRVIRRELRVQDAANLLGLTRRQVGRLLMRVELTARKALFHASVVARATAGALN